MIQEMMSSWEARLLFFCQMREAKTRTGMLKVALQKRLGMHKAARTRSMSSVVTSIIDSYLIYDYIKLYYLLSLITYSNQLMKRGSIHIRRRSMSRRSDENLTIFGVPKGYYEKHLDEAIAMHFEHTYEELEKYVKKIKAGKSAIKLNPSVFIREVQKALQVELDKLADYDDQNIFSRGQVMEIGKNIAEKKRQVEQQSELLASAIEEAGQELTKKAVRHQERKYHAAIMDQQIRCEPSETSKELKEKEKLIEENRSKMMKEASEYNKNNQDNYSSFIKEAGLML